MTTILIRLNDSDLKKLDYLIKIGRYKNRNQAIKAFIQEKLAKETISLDFENSEDLNLRKKIVSDLSNHPTFLFKTNLKKSSAEVISEERERF